MFLAQRGALLSFLRARNAGEAAEDVLHDIWMRLPRGAADIRSPRAYLFRMANAVLIDRRRSAARQRRRDDAWHETAGPIDGDRCERPAADRAIAARQAAAAVLALLDAQGPRVARVFRLHRIDGMIRRDIAACLGVSLSTVEGDLRRAYAALASFRESDDAA